MKLKAWCYEIADSFTNIRWEVRRLFAELYAHRKDRHFKVCRVVKKDLANAWERFVGISGESLDDHLKDSVRAFAESGRANDPEICREFSMTSILMFWMLACLVSSRDGQGRVIAARVLRTLAQFGGVSDMDLGYFREVYEANLADHRCEADLAGAGWCSHCVHIESKLREQEGKAKTPAFIEVFVQVAMPLCGNCSNAGFWVMLVLADLAASVDEGVAAKDRRPNMLFVSGRHTAHERTGGVLFGWAL